MLLHVVFAIIDNETEYNLTLFMEMLKVALHDDNTR